MNEEMTMEIISKLFKEYKEKLPIDQYALDRECGAQPTLYQEASEIFAEARFLLKEASLDLETMEAEHSLAIRADYRLTESKKLTEAMITNIIVSQDDIKILKDKINELQRMANLTQGLVTAYDHKRSMLNNHVDLMRMDSLGYGVGEKEAKEVNVVKKDTRKDFAEKLKRKKRGDK